MTKKRKQSAKKLKKAFESVVERVKSHLGERVKDVRTTFKLSDTPAVVVTDQFEMGTQMAKLLEAAGQQAPDVKYIFELNPEHDLIKSMADESDEQKIWHLGRNVAGASDVGRERQYG